MNKTTEPSPLLAVRSNDGLERKQFEAWISSPPFEHMCDRNSENSAWPGAYKRYETELAWEAWQAAISSEREACAELCDEYGIDKWNLYKGRKPYTGVEEGRAEDYVQGQSDGADNCAQLIRKRSNATGQGSAACGASPAPTGCAANGTNNERTDK